MKLITTLITQYDQNVVIIIIHLKTTVFLLSPKTVFIFEIHRQVFLFFY